MPERGIGNEAQTRIVAEQIARAVIAEWEMQHPRPRDMPKPEIPAPLKWAAAILSAVMTAGVIAMCIWVVTTLSDLQQTVTRMDERQKLMSLNGDARFVEMDRRVTALEAFHRGNNGGKP